MRTKESLGLGPFCCITEVDSIPHNPGRGDKSWGLGRPPSSVQRGKSLAKKNRSEKGHGWGGSE